MTDTKRVPERGDAVNLARSTLKFDEPHRVTYRGIRILCQAVMDMDAYILAAPQPEQAAPGDPFDAIDDAIDAQMKPQPVATRSGPNTNVVCHAPGEKCLGCDHYYGKAPVCKYAEPAPVAELPLKLGKECLDDLFEEAKRDDWHRFFIGSDIRLLIQQALAATTLREQLAQCRNDLQEMGEANGSNIAWANEEKEGREKAERELAQAQSDLVEARNVAMAFVEGDLTARSKEINELKAVLEAAERERDELAAKLKQVRLNATSVVAESMKYQQERDELAAKLLVKTVCPCTLVEPCSPNCSCANNVMSGGCGRCASYGSDEQKLAAAQRLVDNEAKLARFSEAEKKLPEEPWRIDRLSYKPGEGRIDVVPANYADILRFYALAATARADANEQDAERHKFSMRHVSYYSMIGPAFIIDCSNGRLPESDASLAYENAIDFARKQEMA